MSFSGRVLACVMPIALSACTIHHSKQAFWSPAETAPQPDARFVTEEDSGLSLFGVFELARRIGRSCMLSNAPRCLSGRSMRIQSPPVASPIRFVLSAAEKRTRFL